MKRKHFIIAGVLLALLIGGGIAAMLLLGGGSKDAHAEAASGHGGGAQNYVEVPDMVVNLRSVDGSTRLIKLRLVMVAADPEKALDVQTRMPLILDAFQPFLRELRPEDLAGSAAVFRIKEELLLRTNGVVGAGNVSQVLIQDLIQQ